MITADASRDAAVHYRVPGVCLPLTELGRIRIQNGRWMAVAQGLWACSVTLRSAGAVLTLLALRMSTPRAARDVRRRQGGLRALALCP